MASIKLDIVTAERVVFSDDVEIIMAPGIDGELGILPSHTPLMTMLVPGELRVKRSGEEFSLAVSGGFLEIRPDRVIVLADTAERAEEIDAARAEEAKLQAQEQLSQPLSAGDAARIEASLWR